MPREQNFAYLVADGGRARVLIRRGSNPFETLRELESPGGEAPRRDERTRVFQSLGPRRSAAEAGETPAQAARRLFLVAVAAMANEALSRERFDDFFLVAPARIGSAIRRGLAPAVAGKLRASLQKDLTKLPELELQRALAQLSRPLAKPVAAHYG